MSIPVTQEELDGTITVIKRKLEMHPETRAALSTGGLSEEKIGMLESLARNKSALEALTKSTGANSGAETPGGVEVPHTPKSSVPQFKAP